MLLNHILIYSKNDECVSSQKNNKTKIYFLLYLFKYIFMLSHNL